MELKKNIENLDKGVGLKKKLKKSPGRSKSIMKGASSPLGNEHDAKRVVEAFAATFLESTDGTTHRIGADGKARTRMGVGARNNSFLMSNKSVF